MIGIRPSFQNPLDGPMLGRGQSIDPSWFMLRGLAVHTTPVLRLAAAWLLVVASIVFAANWLWW